MNATRAALLAMLTAGMPVLVGQLSTTAHAQSGDTVIVVEELMAPAPEGLAEEDIRAALEGLHPILAGLAWETVYPGDETTLPAFDAAFLPEGFAAADPAFALDGVALAIAQRETRILAERLYMLDGTIVLTDVALTNLAGEARADAVVLAHASVGHLGDFLTAATESRIYPENAGFIAALEVRLDTREIVREDRPGPVFRATMQTEGLLVEGVHVRFANDPRDRVAQAADEDEGEGEAEAQEADEAAGDTDTGGTGAKRLLAERILGGATRGEAVFAGGASFSLARFEGAVTGALDALSPRRLLAHLEQEPAHFATQLAREGRVDLDLSDFVMQVTGRPDAATNAAPPVPVDILIGEGAMSVAVERDGVVTLAGHVGAAEAAPQILAGTPLEDAAMQVAATASTAADRLFGEGRAHARLAPGYAVDVDLWLDAPGLFSLRNAVDVDLPDNLRASLRGGRMAALLPLVFESTARRLTFAMIDEGLGALVEAETGRTLREWVADAVVAEAPAGGGGGMEAMTLQLAIGQLEGVFAMLEDEGSVRLEAVSERPASLVLQALEFLRSARPVADKAEIRP
jgi:enamine deaminase RidA (YjgF/YER057c/UK114 family)